MARALLVFLILAVVRNLGAWGYLLSPGALTFKSFSGAFLDGASTLSLAGLFCVLAWGLGKRLLSVLRIGNSEVFSATAALALGLGISGTLTFWIGLSGSYGTGGFVVLCAFLLAAGTPAVVRVIAARPERLRVPGEKIPIWQSLLLGFLAFSVFNTIVHSLAPPTEWDTLVYHLPIPLQYLKAGGIIEIPWIVHSHWPHMAETLYGMALHIGRDSAPGALHGLVSLALLAATFSAGKRFLGAKAAWLGTAILSAQPIFLQISGTPHSDGFLAFYFFTACLAAWQWTETRKPGWLVVAGLLSGFCASSKLHGLILMAGLGIALLVHCRKEKNFLLAPLVLWVIGTAVVAPWFIKTWVGSGNPVWPFFSSVLGGHWGAADMEGPYLLSSRWNLAKSPGLLLSYGPLFLLPSVLAFSAAAWVARRPWPGFLKFLLLPLLVYLPLVIRQQELWRFMLSFMPAMSLAVGWWVSCWVKEKKMARWGALLAGAIPLTALLTATQNNQLFVVLGARSASHPGEPPRELYLKRSLSHYGFFKKADSVLGPADKVLLFREIRGYYLDADYQWGDPLNQGLIRYERLKTPDDLLYELHKNGITHVLINEGLSLYRYSPTYYDSHVLGLMKGLLQRHSKPVLLDGSLSLHALTPETP